VPTGDAEGRAGLDVSPREGERFGDGMRRRAEHDSSVEVGVEGVVAHAHGVVHDDGARVAARELQLDVPEGLREAGNELVDDVGAGDTPLSGL
jgi:hypothetical protein